MNVGFVRHQGRQGLYTAILNQPGNHYGQIILGRVWNEYDGTGWRAEKIGHLRFRTRAKAARALFDYWGDSIAWSGRKGK